MDKCFEVKYFEKSDNINFDITALKELKGEYALVFCNDMLHYTAEIFKGERTILTVPKAKTDFATKVYIANIYTDEILYEMPWLMDTNTAGSSIVSADKSENVDEDMLISDVGFDIVKTDDFPPESTSSKSNIGDILNKFLDAFAVAKENKSLPDIPFASEVEKVLTFEDVYEVYELLSIPNHNFFVFNENSPENSNVRVRFGEEYISAQSLFLGYSNGLLSEQPDKIIGNAFDSLGNSYKVFGILGENKISHCPFNGKTGFEFFNRLPNSDLGYWLMYLNEKTGALCLKP